MCAVLVAAPGTDEVDASQQDRHSWLDEIERAPAVLRAVTVGMTDAELEDTVPERRLDRAAGGAPPGGQSHE